jgi:cell pole-organizing protein PopZ
VADSDSKISAEPSMEDILSSIKRIIAEDSEATLSGPRVKRSVGLSPLGHAERADEGGEGEDILELSDPVAVDPTPVSVLTPVPPAPEVQPVAVAPQARGEPVSVEAALVSPTTTQASRSSLAALSALIVKPETTGSDTLEGLVRDLLKPMLSEWLDAKLPEIVERQVAQEIARISARG